MRPVNKKELVTFWKSYAFGSGCRNFFERFLNTVRYGIFHNFAYISWKKN